MLLEGFKYQPKNPKNARSSGIGMVFQHFSLFEPLTVLENVLLGLDLQVNKTEVEQNVSKLSEVYGLESNRCILRKVFNSITTQGTKYFLND